MKTLELNQVIKVGNYECKVSFFIGYYLSFGDDEKDNKKIVTQFLPINELRSKFIYLGNGCFPECKTLEQLTQVVEYLKSFEKPEFKRGDRIMVWNDSVNNKAERIFYDYNSELESPFICVLIGYESKYLANEKFDIGTWKHAEPIPQPKQITKDEIKKAFDCETFEIID